jgi:hypothetical protein
MASALPSNSDAGWSSLYLFSLIYYVSRQSVFVIYSFRGFRDVTFCGQLFRDDSRGLISKFCGAGKTSPSIQKQVMNDIMAAAKTRCR